MAAAAVPDALSTAFARHRSGVPDRKDGADVADLLYALTAVAVFAVLLLAVRGLDRL